MERAKIFWDEYKKWSRKSQDQDRYYRSRERRLQDWEEELEGAAEALAREVRDFTRWRGSDQAKRRC